MRVKGERARGRETEETAKLFWSDRVTVKSRKRRESKQITTERKMTLSRMLPIAGLMASMARVPLTSSVTARTAAFGLRRLLSGASNPPVPSHSDVQPTVSMAAVSESDVAKAPFIAVPVMQQNEVYHSTLPIAVLFKLS